MIDADLPEPVSRDLAKCKYLESIIFRLGKDAVKDFDKILTGMQLKY